ncbi:MAG: metallophosphoesterase family protein [Patescibacteria group bacterium]
MKILLLSDLHSSQSTLKGLDTLLGSERFDLVLSPGDITDRHDGHPLEYLDQFINLVTQKHHLPLKMVYGNNDSKEVIEHARQAGVLLHFDDEKIEGYRIAGIGDVESQPEIPGGSLNNLTGAIAVSHRPTPQFKELKASGTPLANAPMIQIFGHLHTRAETNQLGQTLVINVPAGALGRYAVLDLPSKMVQFKWFKDS